MVFSGSVSTTAGDYCPLNGISFDGYVSGLVDVQMMPGSNYATLEGSMLDHSKVFPMYCRESKRICTIDHRIEQMENHMEDNDIPKNFVLIVEKSNLKGR